MTEYRKAIIRHIDELTGYGYSGFDVPIAPPRTKDPQSEVESYVRLREALDGAGLEAVPLSTNVGATRRLTRPPNTPSSGGPPWAT